MGVVGAPRMLTDRLEPGERLTWWSQPRQGLLLRKMDAFMIPFSLMWAGFAVFWESMVAVGNAPWFFKLFGVPFVIAGCYLVLGRFFHDAWRRNRTSYGLTSDRILIATPSTCRMIDLDSLGEITVDEGRDGTGSIAFGRAPTLSDGWQQASWSGAPHVPTFEKIDDVRGVLSKIRAAQKHAEAKARHEDHA
jgi:hypothetical protein